MDSHIKSTNLRDNIIKLTGPVIFELLLGSLFGMVDMIMLGKSDLPKITDHYIAAVGITNQMMFLGLSLVQSLNTGGTAIIARYLGAERRSEIPDVLKHILIISLVFLAIPICVLSIIFASPIMKFIGAEQVTIDYGINYFRIILVGYFFQCMTFAMTAAYRGIGDTRTPMKINIIANLFNVFGNAVLIYGLLGFPAMKITGAAISTMISNIIAFSIISYKVVVKRNSLVNLDLRKKFKFKKDMAINLINIGAPAAGEQLAFRAGVLIFVKIVTSLGTTVYATHQVCLNILSLSFTPGQAFGIAASALVGRSIGEKDDVKASNYIKTAEKMGVVVSVFMGLAFFFFGGYIAELYTESVDVINGAKTILKIVAFIQPMQTSQLIVAGGLRGAGDTRWTLISTFTGVLVIRLIVAYVFVFILEMGLVGAWIGMLTDQAVRFVLIRYRYLTGRWKYIKIR